MIHGRMNLPCAIDSQMFEPISSPDDGATPSLNQKKYSSSCPSQKTGIETPISANSIAGAVPERSALDARDDADRDADEEPQDGGTDRERHRDGQPSVDLFLDRHEVAVRVVDVLVQEQARPGDQPLANLPYWT